MGQKKVAKGPNLLHRTHFVRRLISSLLVSGAFLSVSLITVQAAGLQPSKSNFFYKDKTGKTASARIIYRYRRVQIVHPLARIDSRLDPRLLRAASIADDRAHARSKARCWHYVKEALVAAGAVSSYPTTAYAVQAGQELVRSYGFKRLSVRDPYDAPLGCSACVFARQEWRRTCRDTHKERFRERLFIQDALPLSVARGLREVFLVGCSCRCRQRQTATPDYECLPPATAAATNGNPKHSSARRAVAPQPNSHSRVNNFML